MSKLVFLLGIVAFAAFASAGIIDGPLGSLDKNVPGESLLDSPEPELPGVGGSSGDRFEDIKNLKLNNPDAVVKGVGHYVEQSETTINNVPVKNKVSTEDVSNDDGDVTDSKNDYGQ